MTITITMIIIHIANIIIILEELESIIERNNRVYFQIGKNPELKVSSFRVFYFLWNML